MGCEAGQTDEATEREDCSAVAAVERAVFDPLTVPPRCNRPTDRRAVLGRLERALPLPPTLVVALSGRAVVAVLLE